jgi:hypothetical protein
VQAFTLISSDWIAAYQKYVQPRTPCFAEEPAADALICSQPMAKNSSHILELAKRGAEAQLRDLMMEAKLLLKLFPDLRDSFDNKDELPISFIMAKDSGRVTRSSGGRRRKMSAAARKAISLRMKKYWAGKRKTERT